MSHFDRGVRLQADVPADDDSKPTVHVESDRACDRSLDDAIARIRNEGFAQADAILTNVRTHCPKSAGPLRELAGVRFAQHQWSQAAALAADALAIDPHDEYAWEVLASSRFMQDDPAGALRAWNRLGKPRIDTFGSKA